MFFSLKSDCYFRKYGEVGQIIRPVISIEKVVDEIGAIIISELSYEPQSIEIIVTKLLNQFNEVDKEELTNDVIEFLTVLVNDGFLNMGESESDVVDNGFLYSTLEGKTAYTSLKAQVEESSSHFLSEYFKNTPFLETFHVELTNKCNERCVHCYIPHEMKYMSIDPKLMYKAMHQCKEMGVLTIVFSGGEPMLHPQFCEFLKYAKDLDFNITILSNLTVVTDKIIEALTYRHASCVNVSLYSMIPEVHDTITTIQGSFEITKKNILKLIDKNVPIQINCPVMRQNKDSFDQVIKWGQEHKCSVVTDYLIMAKLNGDTSNLDNRLSSDELETVISKFVKCDITVQRNLLTQVSNFDEIKDDSNERVCGVGMSTLCMTADGNIYPCAGWQKYVCGNLKDSTLKEIWANSPAVNYLRGLRQKDFKKCIGCQDKDFCLMCMGRNSNEDQNGDIFNIPSITCDAAHKHKQIVKALIGQQNNVF